MRSILFTLILRLLITEVAFGAESNDAVNRLLDRIAEKEQSFTQSLRSRTPLMETYIQETLSDSTARNRARRDHYFLGRLTMSKGLAYTPLIGRSDSSKTSRFAFLQGRSMAFKPAGFAQMMFPDMTSFSRKDYRFEYVRREFLGEIRCLVFDVAPAAKELAGKFVGRIWVEDREYQIVRFNGTYTNGSAAELYFHFDSWRMNIGPGAWVPSYLYVEETQEGAAKQKSPIAFKAQTRFWDYLSGNDKRQDELITIAVESEGALRDEQAQLDISPLESQRRWERQAEKNTLERLVRAGLVAPTGPVDEVLNTVVNNLLANSALNLDVTCRVLLTTPLETFSTGRTIVISRGLIDVLPDEASLAVFLADELAHIALGHATNTKFAFHDQALLSDVELLEKLRLERRPGDITAANSKAGAMLAASPYAEKLAGAGLFLKALTQRAPVLPNLIQANLGNQLASGSTLLRMEQIAAQAPELQAERLDQIAALPLGSRIRLNPWSSEVSLIKATPISLISARDKLPFEVTPFMPHLTRFTSEKQAAQIEPEQDQQQR